MEMLIVVIVLAVVAVAIFVIKYVFVGAIFLAFLRLGSSRERHVNQNGPN